MASSSYTTPHYFLTMLIATALAAGCGSTATAPTTEAFAPAMSDAPAGFEQVASESVGLNGRANTAAPPAELTLLQDAEQDSLTEADLVSRLTDHLKGSGWSVETVADPDIWWSAEATKGDRVVRVGEMESFDSTATIGEGLARTSFRSAYREGGGRAMVVMAREVVW